MANVMLRYGKEKKDMNNVDKVIAVLVDILLQYLWDSQQKSEVYDEDGIEWFDGAQKKFDEYLALKPLTEDDVCLCEEADELNFD